MPSKFAQGTDKMQNASKGASFQRTNFFKLEDGEEEIVRFLTDANPSPQAPHLVAWITVQQHNSVPTRPKPDWVKEGANWPVAWGTVCRNTKAEGVKGSPPLWSLLDDDHEGCYVCDNVRTKDGKVPRSSGRGWAVVCLRDEVRDENGQLQGYTDRTRDVENSDGKTVTEKDLQIINLGWGNFFSVLDGMASHFGTIVDRDYVIKRKGSGLDTKYQAINLDPIGLDLRKKEDYDRYPNVPDLDDIIEDQAGWDYQRRYFDPTYSPPQRGDTSTESSSNSNEGAPVQQQQKSSNDLEAQKMADMTARVQERFGKPSVAAEPESEPASEPEPEAPAPEPDPPKAAQPTKVSSGGLRNIE